MNSKYIGYMVNGPVGNFGTAEKNLPKDSNLDKRMADYLKTYRTKFYEEIFIANSEEYNHVVLYQVAARLNTLDDFIQLTECFYFEPEVDPKLLLSEKMGITDLVVAKESLEFGLDLLKTVDFPIDLPFAMLPILH